MALAHAIAEHLPYLRRYARALCGTQKSGDAYARLPGDDRRRPR